MTDERLILITQRLSKHLTTQDTAVVSGYLKNISDDAFMTLQSVELKSPVIGIVLAWFLGAFGGGAFYAKKIGLGITQIISWSLYLFFTFYSLPEQINNDFGVRSTFLLVSTIILLGLFFVCLACVGKWVKKYNFQKIMEILPLL